MVGYVTVGTNDFERAAKFYDELFGDIGARRLFDDQHFIGWSTGPGVPVFALARPFDGKPATVGNGSTVGFNVGDPATVDAWHAAGVANGGKSIEDPPGVREGGMGKMYLAYLRDPSGNKLCALHRMA